MRWVFINSSGWGKNNIWQVDEVANAIEREGEELQGLHGQLNALLEEGKEREKEEEVREKGQLDPHAGGGNLAEAAGAVGGNTANTSHILSPT